MADVLASTSERDLQRTVERQRLLIGSITSLLRRYGESLDLLAIEQTFVHTLMGQFVTPDAALYALDETNAARLVPRHACGRARVEDLPPVPLTAGFDDAFAGDVAARSVEQADCALPPELRDRFEVAAPLRLGPRTTGLLLLGERVGGQAWTPLDLEQIDALCGVSATAFNNARLYRNALATARELERLYALRRDVIDRITHEFRTPLTAIRGCVELIRAGRHTEELGEILVASVDRLDSLIRDLLEFHREPPGEGDTFEPCDPAQVIQTALVRYAMTAGRRRQRFVFRRPDADGDALPLIDAGRLRAILDALVENALQFSGEGDAVEIFLEQAASLPEDGSMIPLSDWRIEPHALVDACRRSGGLTLTPTVEAMITRTEPTAAPSASRWVVVRVVDHGIGIPAEDLQFVAEPFIKGSNAPDRGVRGRGLGLALAQRLVAGAGGSLWCRSEPGIGTEVAVYLPAL